MAGQDRDSVEKLKRHLYNRDGEVETGEERTVLSPDMAAAPTSWSDIRSPGTPEEELPPAATFEPKESFASFMARQPSRSLATKFLFGSMLFFVAATGVAAYIFFGGANLISPQNIDIDIAAPSLIDGGKEATLDVLIRNRNQTALELVDLVIDYPEGARSAADPSQTLTHDRESLGTIASGQQIKRKISGIFYGSEGVEQTVQFTLEYSVAGSNAVFEKKAEVKFTIGTSPVSLSIKSPEKITAGEQFSMEVEVRSNALEPVSDVAVQTQFPFGFTLLSTDPKTESGSTLWKLGEFEPGETKTIKINGSIQGQDGDERIFRFSVGRSEDDTDTKIEVPFVVIPQTITVTEPFISATISVGGQTENITATPGRHLRGEVSWRNNLSESVSDVELSLSFSGPALDENSIDAPNGFYRSSDKSIVWTKDDESSLREVRPGQTEEFEFNFDTLEIGSGGVLITNPIINLNLTVRGVRENGDGDPETVSSVATAKVELTSLPTLSAETFHFSGPFNNEGPMPPRAEDETTYTIVWTVKNSSNTVANTNVTTTLPPYVDFVRAQEGSGITYDNGSHTIKWNIGDVKAGVGYTLPARQAAFQVEISPSKSQVGETPALTRDAVLTGQDRFAQVSVEARAGAPTISINGESQFKQGMDIVAP